MATCGGESRHLLEEELHMGRAMADLRLLEGTYPPIPSILFPACASCAAFRTCAAPKSGSHRLAFSAEEAEGLLSSRYPQKTTLTYSAEALERFVSSCATEKQDRNQLEGTLPYTGGTVWRGFTGQLTDPAPPEYRTFDKHQTHSIWVETITSV